MTKAAVVALLINGVQIFMPSPAVVMDGACWVPLRPVAQRLGWAVEWSPEGVTVRRGDKVVVPQPVRQIAGRTYVKARFFEKCGARVVWKGEQRACELLAEALPPQSEKGQRKPTKTLALVLSSPAAWAGRKVTIRGEFMGWRANSVLDATRHGPPRTRSDWVLRSAGGEIYCTGGMPAAPDQLGLRLEVTGRVRLHEGRWPFIEVESVKRLGGIACCVLVTDYDYVVSDTIMLTLLVRNDTDEPLDVTFPTSQPFEIKLFDSSGKLVWQWSHGRAFLQVISRRTLKPGEKWLFKAEIPLASIKGLLPGYYRIVGELHGKVAGHGEVKSYPAIVRISAAGE